jgi:hypothetical protein
MKKVRITSALLVLVCSLILVGVVLAATSPTIERNVISSGGEQVTDGSQYILNGTIGEPIASDLTFDTTYGLSSGFWAGGGILWYYVNLPIVLK